MTYTFPQHRVYTVVEHATEHNFLFSFIQVLSTSLIQSELDMVQVDSNLPSGTNDTNHLMTLQKVLPDLDKIELIILKELNVSSFF